MSVLLAMASTLFRTSTSSLMLITVFSFLVGLNSFKCHLPYLYNCIQFDIVNIYLIFEYDMYSKRVLCVNLLSVQIDKRLNMLIAKEDFYNWAYSDLLVNNQRGHLAEYIIAVALGIENMTRLEWEPYDLQYGGTKIEIKSCAYIQSWEQSKFSSISFDIAPTRLFNLERNCYEEERRRQSDLYIFCLLKHQSRETINPMDMSQWAFYVTPTVYLNENYTDQKRIALSVLEKSNIKPVSFSEIRSKVDEVINCRKPAYIQ